MVTADLIPSIGCNMSKSELLAMPGYKNKNQESTHPQLEDFPRKEIHSRKTIFFFEVDDATLDVVRRRNFQLFISLSNIENKIQFSKTDRREKSVPKRSIATGEIWHRPRQGKSARNLDSIIVDAYSINPKGTAQHIHSSRGPVLIQKNPEKNNLLKWSLGGAYKQTKNKDYAKRY